MDPEQNFLFPPFKFLQIFIRIIFLKSSLRGNYTQHGRGTKFSIYPTPHYQGRQGPIISPHDICNITLLWSCLVYNPVYWLESPFKFSFLIIAPHKASYIWHILPTLEIIACCQLPLDIGFYFLRNLFRDKFPLILTKLNIMVFSQIILCSLLGHWKTMTYGQKTKF